MDQVFVIFGIAAGLLETGAWAESDLDMALASASIGHFAKGKEPHPTVVGRLLIVTGVDHHVVAAFKDSPYARALQSVDEAGSHVTPEVRVGGGGGKSGGCLQGPSQ